MPDVGGNAVGDTCGAAMTVGVGVTLPGESMAGAANDYTAAFCGDGPDRVFRITVASPTIVRVNLSATFNGGLWQSTTCPPASGQCTQFYTGMPTSFMPLL